jgi:hypothetical protein
LDSFIVSAECLVLQYSIAAIAIFPYGPHLLPEFLAEPLRLYKPKLNRNLIGVQNRKRTVIYQ